MTTGRYSRRNASFRPTGVRRSDRENNFFLAIVGFSLLSHIIVAALFLYTPATNSKRRPPTLYVDLVMAPPVVNPQRGSAGVVRKIAAPVATVPPVAAPPKPVVPAKVTKDKPAPDKDEDMSATIAEDIANKREKIERENAEKAIRDFRNKKPTPTLPVATTVGSASGTGDEAGSANDAWLQKAVKDKWTWTDRKKKDLSAEVEVTFDAAGKLAHYRFIRSSTDARFDDSLKRALLSLEPLPSLRNYKATFLFNLDDLQGQ